MEIYSLGITPRKKEKSPMREHFVTREELVASFGREDALIKDVSSEEKKEKQLVEKDSEVGLGMENQNPVLTEGKKEEMPENKTIVSAGVQEKADALYHSPNLKDPSIFVRSGETKHKAEEEKKETQKTEKVDEVQKNKTPEKKEPAVEKAEASQEHVLNEHEKSLFEKMTKAMRSGNETEFREAVDAIAEYRSENEDNCDSDAPLNIALRAELLKSISAQLAYKGGKEVINVFQLLDLLTIDIDAKDFSILPDEVLKSEEMHRIALKYLQWCTKDLADVPGILERKISSFVHGGILTFDDVLHNEEFHGQIEKNLIVFARDHVKNPEEIERKIFQYSLSGLIDGRVFKKNEKLKDVCMHFLSEFIEKHQDVPDQIEKKIREYEHTGLVVRGDVRKDEKLQNVIVKYLQRYKKLNIGHERKITMRVNDYVRMGLIDRETKEQLLKAN